MTALLYKPASSVIPNELMIRRFDDHEKSPPTIDRYKTLSSL